MTLEEAAEAGQAGPRPQEFTPTPDPDFSAFAQAVHLMDYHLAVDKMRREAALQDAIRRGLVNDEPVPPKFQKATAQKRRRMNPWRHARVLLSETSLPFREIATITGLDIYQVVGLKLKMRSPVSEV